MVTPPRITIRWWDTYAIEDDWYDLDTPHHDRILETTGFLVGETPHYLHIAATWDTHSGQYTTAIAIHKPCIDSRSDKPHQNVS